jgi:hypothetical protein
MDDKIIISGVLTELTLKSKTTFIEAENNKELIALAKSKGIILPSPDLACISTIYCEIGKPNANGHLLTKEAAKAGIKTLVGKNINLNHKGKNYVIGYTIDAKIDGNEITTVGILFKSLFQEEFKEIKQLFDEGKLFVSWELWSHLPESKEPTYKNINGIVMITTMIAHGVGLLLKGLKPACKKSQVFSLLANQKDIKIGESIFTNQEDFVFASLNSEEECSQCKVCLCEKEEKIVEELKVEKIEAQLPEKTKIEIKADETKPVVAGDETKPVEPKIEVTPEVKAQETIVPKIVVKVTKFYSDVFVDTYNADGTMSGTSEGKSTSKTITEYSDGTQDVVEGESEYKRKYTLAELEEKVNAAKAEKDAEIATLKVNAEKEKQDKDTEITSLKAEVEKEKGEKTSKDTEITNLKAELGTKTQELDTIKAKDNRTDDLNVGVVDVKGNVSQIADSIDDKLYGKPKK